MTKILSLVVGNPMLLLWGAFGIFAFGLASGGSMAWKIQGYKLTAAQNEHKAFVAEVKALGDVQNEKAKAADQLHASIVKEKDNENAVLHDKLNITAQRVRDTNTRVSILPKASSGSASPNLSCFDRAELDNALREFSRATSEIAIEGESATIDLDTGKKWVQELSLVK